MLFLLFLYYLLQGPSIDAGPILIIENHLLTGNHCNDLGHCRMTWNIIWSCLVTIFSCTWVAIHPNVPCSKKQEANGWIQKCIFNPLLSFAEHHLPFFICALLVPEYVLAWAIRQYLKAWQIASVNNAFFTVMGGFHLFQCTSKETSHNAEHIFDFQEDNVLLHPLSFHNLYYNTTININFMSFTVPTEKEIKDKGKRNWPAKSLVLLQMLWFVMQCIACAIKHLPVTHLEIVMLAYAALNFVIYIFWWNKPLNINRPVWVFQKSEPSATQLVMFQSGLVRFSEEFGELWTGPMVWFISFTEPWTWLIRTSS